MSHFVLTQENDFLKGFILKQQKEHTKMKQVFWKTKTYFKKMEHHFLFGSAIKNATFLYKSAQSEANIEWWIQNGPIKKTEFCQQLLFFFLKKNIVSVPKIWFDVPTTPISIVILFRSAGVLFEASFSINLFFILCFKYVTYICNLLNLHVENM